MIRLISVLLPDPLEPTSAVVVPAGAVSDTFFSTGTPASYSNDTLSNTTCPSRCAQRLARRILVVLGRHRLDLADPIEAGQRFRQLRADRRHLDERRRQHADEEDVHDEIAERHRPGENRAAADDHHDDADRADDDAAERRDGGNARQRFADVREEAHRAGFEDAIFALFSGVGLDDPDAAERLGEAAGQSQP